MCVIVCVRTHTGERTHTCAHGWPGSYPQGRRPKVRQLPSEARVHPAAPPAPPPHGAQAAAPGQRWPVPFRASLASGAPAQAPRLSLLDSTEAEARLLHDPRPSRGPPQLLPGRGRVPAPLGRSCPGPAPAPALGARLPVTGPQTPAKDHCPSFQKLPSCSSEGPGYPAPVGLGTGHGGGGSAPGGASGSVSSLEP